MIWGKIWNAILPERPTPVLIDLAAIAVSSSRQLSALAGRGTIAAPDTAAFRRFLLKNRKNVEILKKACDPPSQNAPLGEASAKAVLHCRGLCLPLEPLPGHRVAYAGRVELGQECRLLYDARIGAADQKPARGLVRFSFVDSERPVQVECFVCDGSGRAPCRRCNGTGRYRTRSGKNVPCRACTGGRIPCPYCKASRYLDCRLIRKHGSLIIAVPKELRHETALRLRVAGRRIHLGSSPLFRAPRPGETNAPSRPPHSDPIVAAERTFEALLEAMNRFLSIELTASVHELESLRVTHGRIVERLEARGALLEFRFEEPDSPAWPPGSRLLLMERPDASAVTLHLERIEPGAVILRARAQGSMTLAVPESGVLVPPSGLRSIRAQQAAIEHWTERDIFKSKLKRALCLPERLKQIEPASLKGAVDRRIAANPSQLEAVTKALDERFSLLFIQGPPGTGKTSVICEIVLQLLRRGAARILIASQSNLAVDNVLERLQSVGDCPLLRLGNVSRVQPSIRPIVAGSGVSAPHALEAARVVGATCIGSDHPLIRRAVRDQEGKALFDAVILDEVGRSTPMESFVPMQFADRAILVGDHKQLPPVLSSELRTYWKEHIAGQPIESSIGAVSLFEGWIDRLPPTHVVTLKRQFRMHPQIADFVGSVFYEGEGLENGVSAEERALPLPGLPAALSYHCTAELGAERFDRLAARSKSRENPAEAALVAALAATVDEHLEGQRVSAAVITFYEAQARLIRRELARVPTRNLLWDDEHAVETLDSFQGKEKDVIFLSLVRCPSHPERTSADWYRFFLDVRRLNVALSRARRRLFIVGDIARILEVEATGDAAPGFAVLEKLLGYLVEHGLVIE